MGYSNQLEYLLILILKNFENNVIKGLILFYINIF